MPKTQSLDVRSEPSDALATEISEMILRAGAVAVGVTSSSGFEFEMNFITRQKFAGLNDSMQFTYRNPYRSTHIKTSYPYAESIVVAALAYPHPAKGESNHVAGYARWDFYGELRSILEVASERLHELGYRSHVVLDDNALVDKAAARRAGLGWIGKNSLLLVPKVGGNVVLGSIVTNAALKPTNRPVASRCGGCQRCQVACPTGALDKPGVVDVSKCISWLLQREGPFPLELRELVGIRIYGCDECQVACPIGSNFKFGSSMKSESSDQGFGFSLHDLLSFSDEKLLQLCGKFYIPRRSANHMRRNILLALGNKEKLSSSELDALSRYKMSTDPVLKEQAVWSLAKHGAQERC